MNPEFRKEFGVLFLVALVALAAPAASGFWAIGPPIKGEKPEYRILEQTRKEPIDQ
jgi:hypothetical protein